LNRSSRRRPDARAASTTNFRAPHAYRSNTPESANSFREAQGCMGRNRATGAAIKIPAKRVLKFRVAKPAKDAILSAN